MIDWEKACAEHRAFYAGKVKPISDTLAIDIINNYEGHHAIYWVHACTSFYVIYNFLHRLKCVGCNYELTNPERILIKLTVLGIKR